MFEFVYKMFGEGYAAVPKSGMQAIPRQLANNLKQTTFKFNTVVASIKDRELTLESGEKLKTDYSIIATDAAGLVKNLSNQSTSWKSCNTLYFETKKRVIAKPLIGLLPGADSLINNIFYPTSLTASQAGENQLLSVTVVKNHNLSQEDLVREVVRELKLYCGIDSCTFLKQYYIPMALPKLGNLQYEISPSETRLTTSIFLAGDTQLNGSLNAAMISGERAALGLIENISK